LINNRQNGRRRGRGGGAGGAPRPNGGNGGGAERGNRIDNRARGNAAQLHEKYKALARDSQMQGDRVTTEYYLQFADHYFRVLAESRSRFEEQQPRPRRDDYMAQNDGDDEYGDEGDGAGNGNEPSQQRDNQSTDRSYQPRDDDQRRYANDGNNGNNGNGSSYNDGRDDNRGDRSGNDRSGNERSDRRPRRDGGDGYVAAPAPRHDDRLENHQDDRGANDRSRDERPRDDRPREERPRDDRPREDRNRRPRRDREGYVQAPVAAETAPVSTPVEVQEEAVPVKVRRPRRTAAVEGPGEVERIEVDRLPPAFSLTAPIADVANDSDAPVEKPRRRPRRTTGDGTAAEV
jgi:hypothetical protein